MTGTERKGKRSAFPPGAAQVPPRPRLRLSVAFGVFARVRPCPIPRRLSGDPVGRILGGHGGRHGWILLHLQPLTVTLRFLPAASRPMIRARWWMR